MTCTRDDGNGETNLENNVMGKNLPLLGLNILLTRPREQSGELKSLFEAQGATVFIQPTIAILPPEDWKPVDRVIDIINCYDILIFVSSNGVRSFFERSKQRLKRNLTDFQKKTAFWFATGPGTRETLEKYGISNVIIPDKGFDAEGILSRLSSHDVVGKRVLIVRGTRGRPLLPDELRRRKAEVEQIVVYQSVDLIEPPQEIAFLLRCGKINWVAVTSSAIAASLVKMFGESLRRSNIVSIGPVTSQTLAEFGFSPTVEAMESTLPALVDAVVEFVAKR